MKKNYIDLSSGDRSYINTGDYVRLEHSLKIVNDLIVPEGFVGKVINKRKLPAYGFGNWLLVKSNESTSCRGRGKSCALFPECTSKASVCIPRKYVTKVSTLEGMVKSGVTPKE
jgi:hypothetical protein